MAKRRKSSKPKSRKGKTPKNGKVAKKIKLLLSEGKPQKQAIAIAYNMKRRKKL